MNNKGILLLFLAVLLLVISSFFYRNYLCDDLFISLQFAKNLSEMGEFSFNRGEPVYGFTSPLWIILLSLGKRTPFDFVLTSRILSTIFGIATIPLFFLLARTYIPDERIAIGITFLWAYDPWFIRWVPSGMETSLALFLLFLSLYFYLIKESSPLSFGFLALATLTRPEFAFLFFLMVIHSFFDPLKKKNSLFKGIILYLLLLIPWFFYSFFQFGSIIPNTLKVKHGFPADLSSIVSSFSTASKIVSTYLIEIILILWLFWKKRSQILKSHFFVWCWILGVPLFYGLGGLMLVSRYLLLILPFLILFGGLGLYHLFLARGITERVQLGILLTVLWVLFLGYSILSWRINFPAHQLYSETLTNSTVYIGRWFFNNTPPNATIMILRDFGTFGYFSQRKIYDCMGIITPQFIPLWKRLPDHPILRDALYADWFRPDYVVDATRTPHLLTEDSSYPGLYKFLFTRGLTGRGQLANTLYYTVYQVDWSHYR